jgi:hypothetical protein
MALFLWRPVSIALYLDLEAAVAGLDAALLAHALEVAVSVAFFHH